MVYVQLLGGTVAALDLATGLVRSTDVDVSRLDVPYPLRLLHGSIAYEMLRTLDDYTYDLRAIDVATGAEPWRHSGNMGPAAVDEDWVYAIGPLPESDALLLTVFDRTTGASIETLPIGHSTGWAKLAKGAPRGSRVVLPIEGNWVFALGDITRPEPRRDTRIHGRLRMRTCGYERDLPGVKVTIGGSSTITGEGGRFVMRVRAGLAPERFRLEGAPKMASFPNVVMVAPDVPPDFVADDAGEICHDE